MKKLFAVLLVFTMIATAVYAAGGQGKQQQKVLVQIGAENQPGEPIMDAVNEWARLAKERSGGTLDVQVFPSSQLGTKDQLADQMLAGMPVITLANGGFFATRGAPDLGILFGPYFYQSWDDAWKLIASDWFKSQVQTLEKAGLRILAPNWRYGDRHTLSSRPIRSVADYRGLKLRVPNNRMQVLGSNVLGAVTTPMPLGEVYTALQQGVVDAVEQDMTGMISQKFYEVTRYLSFTGHIRDNTMWFTGTTFFNSLSPEHQKILIDTGLEAGLYNNKLQETADEVALKRLLAEGVTVVDIDLNSFVQASQAFYTLPELVREWTPGLIENVRKAMGR